MSTVLETNATQLKPRTAATNGRLWGARAEDWSRLQERCVAPAYEAVLARLSVGAGMQVLDVGCGAGMAAARMAERGARVAGIDAAEALIAVARSRVPAAEFHVGDMEELPF